MGSVWLAEHLALSVPCALKLVDVRSADADELRARFELEAKAAAQIRSRHAVHIYDHGLWNGAPFIAMELLDGEDLASRLERERTLGPAETLRIVAEISRALGRAHALGIVHRDLKPENVFLARDDDGEVAKVLDFGIAKVQRGELTDTTTKPGMVMGTPFYMSPEQARGTRNIDHRSDLWALAAITFECLTGRMPFPGEAVGEVLGKIMYEPIPRPSDFADVPSGFGVWWEKATQRDPEHRFQSAAELVDALAIALAISLPDALAMRASMPSLPRLTPLSQRFALNAPTAGNPAPPRRAEAASDESTSTVTSTHPAPVSRRWLVFALPGLAVAATVAFVLTRPSPGAPNVASPAACAAPLPLPPASVVVSATPTTSNVPSDSTGGTPAKAPLEGATSPGARAPSNQRPPKPPTGTATGTEPKPERPTPATKPTPQSGGVDFGI
jgi:serine/threonine protein kinase